MKKLLLIPVLALMPLLAGADDSQPVDQVAQTLNSRCPFDFNDGLVLEAVSVDSGSLLFSYRISTEMYENISSLGGILHDSMVAEMVSSPDKDIHCMLEICKEANINIVQKFSDNSDNSFSITIIPDDLK